MSLIKINELRPTMDYLLCVLESHGLSALSIKDYASTFHAFEGYVIFGFAEKVAIKMVSDLHKQG